MLLPYPAMFVMTNKSSVFAWPMILVCLYVTCQIWHSCALACTTVLLGTMRGQLTSAAVPASVPELHERVRTYTVQLFAWPG